MFRDRAVFLFFLPNKLVLRLVCDYLGPVFLSRLNQDGLGKESQIDYFVFVKKNRAMVGVGERLRLRIVAP